MVNLKNVKLKKKGNLKNENRGITLIALVITIIVLLILAGISISTLTGENGLLTKSSTSKVETRGAAVQEARDLWKINQEADKHTENKTAETLSALLERLGPNDQKLLTTDEMDEINATGQVTIGSRTIVFGTEEKEIEPVIIGDAELSNKYGEMVKYNGYASSDVTEWQLFFADDSNIYLISKNLIGNSPNWVGYEGEVGEPGLSLNSNVINWENRSGSKNAATYLLDVSKWSQYCSNVANWAIGGPTVDLFLASYNATHETQINLSCDSRGYNNNYDFSYTLEIDKKIYCGECGYNLASPGTGGDSYVFGVGKTSFTERGVTTYYGYVGLYDYLKLYYCRPFVSIPRSHFDEETMSVF